MNRLFILLGLLILGGCSHVFYQPSARHFVNPTELGLVYDDIYFKSKDGTKLHGWFFPAQSDKPKGTIIQFHGNAQNISTHFLNLIWLTAEGYNLFTFDYRGYAKSEGSPSQAGVHQDALAALDKGYELHTQRGGTQFIIIGQSLGGAIALRATPDWKHNDKVTLMVIDSSFASYQKIASSKLKARWFLWPFTPLAYLLISDEYAPQKKLSQINTPLLVITGDKDHIVPAEFGAVIYRESAARRKWWWQLPEGEHINVFHHAQGKYRQEFLAFLDDLMPR